MSSSEKADGGWSISATGKRAASFISGLFFGAPGGKDGDENPQPSNKRRKTTTTTSSAEMDLVLETVREHTARAEAREKAAAARAETIEALLEAVLERLEQRKRPAARETFSTPRKPARPLPLNPNPPSASGQKLWTQQERSIVVKGLAAYGMGSAKRVAELLKHRNYSQTRGFMRRNADSIRREIEATTGYATTEAEKQEILDSIAAENEEDGEDDNSNDDDDDDDDDSNEEASGGGDDESESAKPAMPPKRNTGSWSVEEQEAAARGLVIHGTTNTKAIAQMVGTRNTDQVRRYIGRHYHKLLAMGTNSEESSSDSS
ncbi:unnamed protein product [Pseudo-nitzschia multistriata]|uniref:Myb-like domain-containing protein n=1 Tax=Pseudo-nitzschia multistriata TaxID=183589 RepID=A0A448Z304_9STRA|nr:unnamed protein product [Pseudo-nitzschia multistriata]